MTTMILANKISIIYGAGGAVGRTVAETFAREGARVFLTGRTKAKVDLVAEKINAAGGFAEAAEVDALDEQAIKTHLNMVIAKANGITRQQFHDMIEERTHRKLLPSLQEMAEVAAFMACDRASAMTGTIVNMSIGGIAD